jgi:CRP-like cAMP-binding protein
MQYFRNHLLTALPAEVQSRLASRMERVELPLRHIVHRPEQPIDAAYFHETGWSSSITQLSDGGGAEIGHAGPEGMVGLPLVLGSDTGLAEVMVQCPGTALRIGAAAFAEELEREPAFRNLLLRYAQVFYEGVAQTAACNASHRMDQRLARWLLMAHDRADGDEFAMTQEFMAMMLGVQRPGVTIAAGQLQQQGLIRSSRGAIAVTNRPGLEQNSCECYRVVRRRFEALIGSAGA